MAKPKDDGQTYYEVPKTTKGDGMEQIAKKFFTAENQEFKELYVPPLTRLLRRVAREATRREREACAKLSEDYGNSLLPIIKTSAKIGTPYHLRSQGTAKGAAIGAERIANAIRNRRSA